MKQIDITPELKLSELFEFYPDTEASFISLVPVFKNLVNPFLRKNIAKVTTLRQASIVGNVPLGDIINKLRAATGQKLPEVINNSDNQNNKPFWLNSEKVVISYDAIEDLNNGIHPVNKVTKETAGLNKDEIYELITPFVPKPLIDILEKKGFEIFVENVSNNRIKTFILNPGK